MRILILGHGSMGRRRAAIAEQLGHTVIIYDPVTTPTANEREMINDVRTYDAVVIASPAPEHARQFWHVAMRSNVPILVEKPLARSVSDFFMDVGLKTGVTNRVRVGYNLRFHVGLRYLKAQLAAVGTIHGGTFCVSCDGSTWPGASYEDALLECSHELDLARWLLGPCDVVGASRGANGRWWDLLLQHADGPVSTVHLDTVRKDGYVRQTAILGETGTLTWNWLDPVEGNSHVTFEPDNPLDADSLSSYSHMTAEETYRLELTNFLNAGPADIGCTLAEGLAVLDLCDQARRLAK